MAGVLRQALVHRPQPLDQCVSTECSARRWQLVQQQARLNLQHRRARRQRRGRQPEPFLLGIGIEADQVAEGYGGTEYARSPPASTRPGPTFSETT
ncbi:MAG: hypothetical protein LBQ06_04825 [Frankiaceae bacterium]|jgi:hypothetical protein|nr:hypothetical protein [Frankiaceae bacterium]